MIVERVNLKDFRSYESLAVELPAGISVFHGANGAGKTNLLEAIYTGLVGRSCRTNSDTRMIRFGCDVARVEIDGSQDGRRHTLAVGLGRAQKKALSADGVEVPSFEEIAWRPLAAVFMPDRLEIVKGPPGIRRAHFDQVSAALWPARRATRRAYASALAQRNALIARGDAGSAQLDAWDRQLAEHGSRLIADRAELKEALEQRTSAAARQIGLDGELVLTYKPSFDVAGATELYEALIDRRQADLERGYTYSGPHRDDFALVLAERDLRTFGSQGQQRAALLALLLAECSALAELAQRPPLVLLDDVMSELDDKRRNGLLGYVAELAQCVVTTTDLAYVPDLSVVDATFSVAAGTVERS